MAYHEAVPTTRHALLFLVLFPVLYLVNLSERDLRPHEALQATIATELDSREPLVTTAHGVQVPAFPVYPWLIRGLTVGGRPNEWTTRLPTALAVLAMAVLAGMVARHAGGDVAGLVAAAVVLTSVAVLREGVLAGTDTLFALFLGTAWFAWFWLGREKQSWGGAWVVSLVAVLAATFTSGAHAFVWFYFPLLLIRRPLLRWRRVLLPAHLLGLVAAIAVLVYWRRSAPGQIFLPWETLLLRAVPEDTGSYLTHLITFPFKCTVYVLPWLVIVWPGFCMAYRPLEKNPMFCHYLRTILVSLFVASWLLPKTPPRVLVPLLCPLAVLTGIHYDILVRRHYLELRRLGRGLASLTVVVASGFAAVGILHLCGVVVFTGMRTGIVVFDVVLLLIAAGVSYRLLRRAPAYPVWVLLLVSASMTCLSVRATYPTWRGWLNSNQREYASVLRRQVPEDVIIHKTVQRLMMGVCFYLDRRITQIAELDKELPTDVFSVYVLGGRKPPILPARTWTACSKPVELRLKSSPFAVWFPGGFCLLRLSPVPDPMDRDESEGIVCMYRGDLR